MSALLKPLRVALSLLILCLFLFLFLDSWTDLTDRFSLYLTDTQLIPYYLRWISTREVFYGGGILLILLSLLFGRVYCSSVCPLGTIQDMLIRLRRIFRSRRRRFFRLLRPHRFLRYGILLLVLLSLASGMTTLLLLLDPYSISGRFFTTWVKPLFTMLYNAFTESLQAMNYYAVKPLDWHWDAGPAAWFALGWMFLVSVMSVVGGRLYCNTLCPVGTLLGLLSHVSIWRIRIAPSKCTLCAKCGQVCKAGCINMNHHQLDFSRCVACMNCINVCSEGAVTYHRSRFGSIRIKESSAEGRRKFLKQGLGLGAVIPLAGSDSLSFELDPLNSRESAVRKAICPPGSLGRAHFTSFCTSCYLCVSQCPTKVLQPSILEFGIEGLYQPMLDFSIKYCSYECNICSLVCPCGAIIPLSLEAKKQVQMGKARLIEHLCIVVTKGTHCGACSEHCPTKACDMVPYVGNLTIPKVNTDICTGCGACEHACPTSPRSIVVDENEIHLLARLPAKKVLEALPDKEEDNFEEFPF
ncbi:MAG TPA: 4Fe-4S binding protein [Bacteroidales bacterium]|nr:4Fe-4S binding protein [Bacteroidales bacterium]HSA43101.1 4Fe-4S binding protein [Bacteroidales bacterium]